MNESHRASELGQVGDKSSELESSQIQKKPEPIEELSWLVQALGAFEKQSRPGFVAASTQQHTQPQQADASKSQGVSISTECVDGNMAMVGNSEPENVTSVELDGGSLGKIGFSVERGPQGISVTFAMEDGYASNLFQLEKQKLIEGMRAQGLTVKKVEISQVKEVGIALAKASTGNPPDGLSKAGSAYRTPKTGLRYDEDELNLFG